MPSTNPIPAAQYLRMSSEHQQYSIENQSAAVAKYAECCGFKVVQSYIDKGKSGLVLKRRSGLAALLRDVLGGNANYKAILVYDVSRWGRFQDPDEGAHYEFICKGAGAPVHYCAEPFGIDGAISTSVLKALKRSMAAEFSRQLGIRVTESHRQLAKRGFRLGGKAPFGLRRALISANGVPGRTLEVGETKCVRSAHVVLRPGPSSERACVRSIFKMALQDRMQTHEIAHELNWTGPSHSGRPWTPEGVRYVLSNPAYTGCNAWGRTCQKLKGHTIDVAPEHWVSKPDAFAPIIDKQTFHRAQAYLSRYTAERTWTAPEILKRIRSLLKRSGKLTSLG
jgi:DNA invertase Pin-like site-specific DNA recombinase